jgi:leader peptidase (prepilin peptidase)/N-methyltransferase
VIASWLDLLLSPPLRLPIWGAMGLLWGSFANVCIARIPVGESVVGGRSRCPRCAKPIAWYDNVPVLSFLWLRGRCRGCALPISRQYPLVELATGILFPATLAAYEWDPRALIYLPFVLALVIVTGIDLWHRIIPDRLTIGGAIVGFALTVATGALSWHESVTGAAAGFALFFALAWSYRKWKGVEGLGFGDVKFLAMLGAWLGYRSLLPIIVVASVAGSAVGLVAIARRGGGMQSAIPFGPFLVLGALLYLFFPAFWGEYLFFDGPSPSGVLE